MGQNPTSGVLSLHRRREIYAICCEYDVIICEDDPYWYLQFPSATSRNTTTTADSANISFNPDQPMFANAEPVPEGWKSSGYDFLDSLVPSSINIDTEGRVIRLDTFSKTVAPGCRLGWITAQPAFVERILRISETSTQQPSGFVQSMIAELLIGQDPADMTASKKDTSDPDAWNAGGWIRWIEGLRGNYERRMNAMAKILDDGKYLVKSGRRNSLSETISDDEEWSVVEKTQIMSFDYPVGGMFLWLRVHFESHPLYYHYAKHDELSRLSRALWIYWTTKPYLVLASPGTIFSPTPEINAAEGWKYFRLCFAAIDEVDLEDVSERLRDGVQAFFRIKDKKVVEELLSEEDEEKVMAREGLVSVAGIAGC
jgi:DNA-binding transcriptional MocR family regulator